MPRLAWVLFAAALAVRVFAIGFGLDFERPDRALLQHQTDERGMVASVREHFLRGDFDPGDFLYRGPACFFVFGTVDAAALAVRAAIHGTSFAEERAAVDANPSLLHLLHRAVSALASALSVLVVLRFARREWGERCGWIAATFVAFAYLNVREAHFGTVDAVWGLATALALDQIFRIATTGDLRAYVWAATWSGVAGAVRYFGALLCILIAVAHVTAIARARRESTRRPPFSYLAIAALMSILAFALAAPNVLYDLPNFVDKLVFSAQTFTASADDRARELLFRFHAVNTIGAGLGETMALAILAGFVAAWRMAGNARLLATAALGLLPSLFAVLYSPVRFGIGPAIALLPLAALGIDALTRRRSRAVVVVCVLVALAPSLVRDVAFLRVLRGRDVRFDLIDALEQRGAQKTDVVAVGHYGLPFFRGWFDLYEALRGQSVASGGEFLKEFAKSRPRFVVLDRTSGYPDALFVSTYGDAWTNLTNVWAKEYRVVLDVDSRKEPPHPELPDTTSGTPHFLVHFREPWAQMRPGGGLQLLERIGP